MQTIDELYTTLQGAREGDALVLLPGLFASPAVQGLVRGRPGQQLALRSVRIQGPPETSEALTLHGTAAETWAVPGVPGGALAGVEVELAFRAASDGPPAVSGTLRGTLRLGDTPLAVEGTLADDGSVTLRVEAGALPDRPLTEWTRAAGASVGSVFLPAPLGDPGQLPAAALSLTLAPTTGVAAVEVTGTLPGTWDLVPGSVGVRDLSLVLRADAQDGGTDQPGSVTLAARVEGTVRLGGEWRMVAALDGRGGAVAGLYSADGDVLPGLGDLAELAGGTALREAVQSGFDALRLSALRLRRASLSVDVAAGALRTVEVEGAVTLDGIELQAGLVLSPPVAGDDDDDGEAADFALTGGLAPGSRIPLRDLAAKWLPAVADLPALDVTALDVFARPAAGRLRLRAEVASDWTLRAGGLDVTLRGVRMALERTPQHVGGELEAWCEVAGVRVSVEAEREEGAWTFRGALDNPQSTTVASLLSRLTGSPVVLPDLVPDVAVRSVRVELTPATGALAVDAAAVFAWKDGRGGAVRVDAAVHFSRGGDAPWSCTLTVKADGGRRFCDGVEMRAADLHFALDGAGTWSAAGGMSGSLFQREVDLHASYRADGAKRVLSLASTERVEGSGVALAGVGGFALTRFALDVERTLVEGRSRSRWSVDADALLGGVAAHASARMDGALTLSARVPEVRVAELVARFLPEGTALPPELSGLAEVTLRDLEGSFTPATGVVHLSGTMTGLVIPLPFGAGRLELRTLSVRYDRDVKGDVTFHLGLTGAGALGEGLVVDEFDFSLDYDGSRELALGGHVDASVLGQPVRLEASVARGWEAGKERTAVRLAAVFSTPWTIVDLPDVATFALRDASAELVRAGGTEWTFSAAADFVTPLFALRNGRTTLYHRGAETGLRFTAEEARVSLDFPAVGDVAPGFDADFRAVEVMHVATGGGRAATAEAPERVPGWNVAAEVGYAFRGLPDPLGKVFAAGAVGRCVINAKGARFEVTRITRALELAFPPIDTGDGTLELGTGVLDVRLLRIDIGAELALSGTLSLGLPSRLNHVFGTGADGSPRITPFRCYDPARPLESTVDVQLRIGTDGIGAVLQSSPLNGVVVRDGWWDLDLGDFGRVLIQVPELAVRDGAFRASGGFKVDPERGISLPLGPLKALLTALDLPDLAQALPRGLPIRPVQLVDPDTGRLRTAELEAVLRALHLEVPAELAPVLEAIVSAPGYLPKQIRQYLQVGVPSDLQFHLSITPDGGVEGAVRCGREPLRLLIPNFPAFMGIELRGLSFGEALGGALLVAEVDATVDVFHLPAVAAAVAIGALGGSDLLPGSTELRQTLELRRLLLLIVYQAGVPIPIPAFYERLGVDYVGVEGVRSAASISFPRPVLDVGEAVRLVSALVQFVRDPERYLQPADIPQKMRVKLTVGPAYLRLPPYLGGTLLGRETPLLELDPVEILAWALNTLKRRSLVDLIRRIPLDDRVRSESVELMAGLRVEADLVLATPHEFVTVAYPRLKLADGVGAREVLAVLPGRAPVPGDPADVPPPPGEDEEGVVALLRGALDLGGAARLEAVAGVAASGTDGFGAGLRLSGDVAGIFHAHLAAVGRLAPNDRRDPFRLEGSARVAFTPQSPLGDWTVLAGAFRVSRTEAAFDGELSLFPPAFPVQVGGRAAGYVNARQFYLSATGAFLLRDPGGRTVVSFGAEVTLRAGSWEVDGRLEPVAELRAVVRICGAEARLLAEARDGLLRLAGAATPIAVLGGALRVTGGGPEGGPVALLEVDRDGLRAFRLSGAVSLLGISGTAVEVAYDRELLRFALQHEFHLIGVHSSMALACRWVPDRYLAANSDFQVTLDLGEVLTALVRDVLRLPFPTLRIPTGIRVQILELLIVEDSRRPDGTLLPESGARRLARQDPQVEAYRRRRAELHAQADVFLRELSDGIHQARRQRLAGERRLDAARAELRAAEERLAHATAEAERERLALVSQPAELPLAEYQLRLSQAAAAAVSTRTQVEALRSALAQEKGRFEAELRTVQARLNGIQDEMDALEEGRAYDRLDTLRAEQVRLNREKELYRRKLLSLADVQAQPAPRTADDDVAAAQEAEASAAGDAGADPPPALDLMDRVWTANAEASQLAAAEARGLPTRELAEPIEDGPSRFLLRMQASFTFLGIPITLPEMTFVRSDLGMLSTEDVLARIPELLMAEVRQQTQAALRSAFASFADLGRFLVRLVFDADFRASVLGEGARTVDTGMSETELSRFLDELERSFPLPPELDEFRRRVHDAAREVERALREGAHAVETAARKVLSWLEWALADIARLLS